MAAIGAVLLSLVLFGCATGGVEKVEQLKPGTKIIPLSLMGDKLAIRHIGTTVLQNESRDLDTPSWGIDKYVEATAARAILQGARFSAIVADSAQARKSVGKLGQDFWTSAAVVEGGQESVVSLAKDAGADYVLVLGPSQIGDPFFGTNQRFSGYGIAQRSFMGMKRGINFLTMRLVLLDGRDGREVARTQSYLGSPRARSDWIEGENLPLSESNATTTKVSIESLVDRMLGKGLADLKLIQ